YRIYRSLAILASISRVLAPISDFFSDIKGLLSGGSGKAGAVSPDSAAERRLEGIVTSLVRSCKAVPLPKSKVIELEFKYDDPVKAKEILATHLKLYLPYHQKAYSVPGAQKFFSGQGVVYKKKMEEANNQLMQFKTKWGLASPDTQKSQLIKMISQVRDALVGLNANEIQYGSMVQMLKDDVIPTGQLSASLRRSDESTVVNVIAAQLIRAEQKRLEAQEAFAKGSRNLGAADDMVNTLKKKLKQTLDGELKNLEVTKTSLQQSLKELEKKLEVLEEKSQAAKTLEIEAKIAKERYILYASRGEQAKIENLMERKNLVNARVVSQPYIPASPVFPKKGLMVLGAFLLAFPLGLGMILAANFMDRTFDTPQEVEAVTGLKVLASLKRVPRRT
ncbi:GumC family protein, partial [Thermodesulfobacteriota bacterium]